MTDKTGSPPATIRQDGRDNRLALGARELKGGAKRRIGIEALLRWAYVQELPKAGSGTVRHHAGPGAGVGGWDMVSDYAELLTLIDTANQWGCVPDFSAEAEPHPDAVLVGRAVAGLADLVFEAPAGYDLLADIVLSDGSALSEAERTDAHDRGLALARINGGRWPATIARLAILGRAPDWQGDGVIARRTVAGPQGAPAWFRLIERPDAYGRGTVMVEIDGYNRVGQRPHPGAYRKTRLVPDPAGLVERRAEYQAFVLTLAALAADLDGRLAAYRVSGPERGLWPWEGGERRAAPRVIFAGKPEDARRRA